MNQCRLSIKHAWQRFSLTSVDAEIMSKPDIAILTICAELSAELQSCLKPNCDVTVHAGLSEFDESLNSREPAYLIADFRGASGGGH
jgi:hypothetical protein